MKFKPGDKVKIVDKDDIWIIGVILGIYNVEN